MTLSGNLSLDPAAHAAASSSLSERLAELDQRRRSAQRTVEGLLTAWRGDAASHFETQWRDWDDAATEVIDALSALLGAIDLARGDLVTADAERAADSQDLAGRLR